MTEREKLSEKTGLALPFYHLKKQLILMKSNVSAGTTIYLQCFESDVIRSVCSQNVLCVIFFVQHSISVKYETKQLHRQKLFWSIYLLFKVFFMPGLISRVLKVERKMFGPPKIAIQFYVCVCLCVCEGGKIDEEGFDLSV